MPLKPHGGCKACKKIAEEGGTSTSKLYKMINTYQLGGLRMTEIAVEYRPDLKYNVLHNHSKKHQHISEKRLIDSRINAAQKEYVKAEIRDGRHHTKRREDILNWLEQKIESGEVKPTAAAVVSLLKQEADIEEKQKDRSLEVYKMMNKFQSGELERSDPRRITAGPDQGL